MIDPAGGAAKTLELRRIDEFFVTEIQPEVVSVSNPPAAQLGEGEDRCLAIDDDKHGFRLLTNCPGNRLMLSKIRRGPPRCWPKVLMKHFSGA
ncbi:MAG: hypothetical protein KAI47_08465 [Deltaproteobacteria bacterium]|nr:hypothetical protein [Deltaproteobacteria bacterium]